MQTNTPRTITINKTNKALITASALSLAISTALSATEHQGLTPQIIDDTIAIHTQVSPLPERYIIKYKSAQNASLSQDSAARGISAIEQRNSVLNRIESLGIKIAEQFDELNIISAQLSAKELQTLQLDNNIEYVEKDHPRRLMAQSIPYGIGMVQADQVSDNVASASANGKKICVIDSGLQMPHEDMGTQGNTVTGTNDSGTGNWYEHGGPHGTHVAGTIAALNNGTGVRGVIGSNPNLHIIKVFTSSGWAYSSKLVDAINTCKTNGSNVINMSLGGSGSNTTERDGIQAAYDAGVLLIAAAGNDGKKENATDAPSYPASYDSVMSVAAIDSNKALADFSQKNSQVEIAAPGVDVVSTYPTGLGSVTETTVNGVSYTANAMKNKGTATAALYNFGTGEATDSGASGKVCLIKRGNISFHDKVKNCQTSGGVASIIYNNAAGKFSGTLGDNNTTTIPSVTVTDTDGATMLNNIGQSARVNIGAGNYGKMSGTSMASPHVAGVAALVWSHHASCTNKQIRAVLNATAQDLGDSGRDVKFGYGLVQTKAAVDYISSKGCDGQGTVTPPTGGDSVLKNGEAKSNLSGAKDSKTAFTMEIPSGATKVVFTLSGGTGDADLYVKSGVAPTTSAYDCRSWNGGNNETCTINNPTAGTYHIMLNAYAAFSGASLKGDITGGSSGGGIQPINSTVNNVSVTSKAWKRYTLDLAAGYKDMNVTLTGGSGDADLYINFGSQSTKSSYQCRSWESGNNETCTISTPQAGKWYIDVHGYSAASGITLNLKANP